MPRVLITGVAGQTGSYLAEALLAQGWECHGLVRNADARSSDIPSGVVLHEADLTDSETIARVVTELAPDTIVNLAALSSVAASWKQPLETANVNGVAVAALLDAASRLGDSGRPCAFVQASSAEIFGQAPVSPQNETTPLAPVNPYGAAKAYAHLLTGTYRNAGLTASNIILYNHESPRRPDTFVTRKITQGVARIARGLDDELLLGNLDARRDWGWAPDYADAIARVVSSHASDDFVVATGQSHSIMDFVRAAFAAASVDDPDRYVRSDPRFQRPADVSELAGDSTKIREALGWKPTVPFDEMVRRMVENDLRLLDTTS